MHQTGEKEVLPDSLVSFDHSASAKLGSGAFFKVVQSCNCVRLSLKVKRECGHQRAACCC